MQSCESTSKEKSNTTKELHWQLPSHWQKW